MKSIRILDERGVASIVVGIAVVVVVAVGAGAFVLNKNSKPSGTGCTSKTLAQGSTGACVSSAQTLANWRAYGIDGSKYIPVTGTFDAATVTAVKLAQTNSRLPTTGTIDSATWKQLCSLEDAPSKVVTAAKNAGC